VHDFTEELNPQVAEAVQLAVAMVISLLE